jgi:hypothetical protein
LNPVPLLPFGEKGLGDEGKLAKLGCSLIHSPPAKSLQPLIPPSNKGGVNGYIPTALIPTALIPTALIPAAERKLVTTHDAFG